MTGKHILAAGVLLASIASAAGGDVPIGAELLVNGGFDKLDERGRPVGWRWSPAATVRRADGRTWVSIASYGSVNQAVAIAPTWLKLRVRFRMRVTDVRRGDDGWKNARLAMAFHDAGGKRLDPWPDVLWAEGSTDWKTYQREFLIPAGARSLHVGASMFGLKGGTAEYDDISIKLIRKRAMTREDLPAPEGFARAWDLADAWGRRSAMRETVCLNGLWRFLPVLDGLDPNRPPSGPQGWGWFKVPGIWPRGGGEGQDVLLSPYVEERVDLQRMDRAWYRRTVRLPARWDGLRIALELTMVQTHVRAYVDGKAAGELFFPGGRIDLTDRLRPGTDHTLDLLVTARPLAAERTAFMAPDRVVTSKAGVNLRGLTGDVFLRGEPKARRIADVRTATKADPPTLSLDVAVRPGKAGERLRLLATILRAGREVHRIESEPFDPTALPGGRVRFSGAWAEAKLWDLDTPENLYELSVAAIERRDGQRHILDATLPRRLAFREFRIRGRDFLLNGTPVRLRALLTRNINRDAGRSCAAACRTTCERLKHYGFNFFITSNYHLEPGSVGYLDAMLDAADAAGVLCSVSLPHVKNFDWRLDEPGPARRYRQLCEWIIRRVREHPSVVLYAMNHNACGYKGDQNPRRMDGVYSPDDPKFGGPGRNRRQALLAAEIARSIDPTRPVYHHQSGNLGEMYTVNIYLNWAPMQERSDWLEHWSARGVKPMFFVEWGLPHVSSWSSYRGPNFIWRSEEFQSIRDAEFNAAYLGGGAYEMTPRRRASREHEERLWAAGEPFHWGRLIRYFRDDPDGHIRMKAMFADENWRSHRTWGVSAMLPWDQEQIWRVREGAEPEAAEMQAQPARLKRPGIVADRRPASESWLHCPDADAIEPTALGESFLRWNKPLCAFIGGGADANDFTDKAHHYLPGQTVRKQLVILNDTRRAATCQARWRLVPARPAGRREGRPKPWGGHAGEAARVAVAVGGQRRLPIAIPLPAAALGRYELRAEFDFGPGGRQTDSVELDVLAEPAPLKLGRRMLVFDPEGMTCKLLDRLGAKYETIGADARPTKGDLLVIGREAIDLDTKLPDLSAVPEGLAVVLFEQSAETLTHRLGFRINVHGLRRVFDARGAMSHRDWRGEGTLVPPYLPIDGRETDNPRWTWCGFRNTRVWRCRNRGTVASVLIEKPPVGRWRAMATGGFDLQYAPLLAARVGLGRVVFCQLDVTARTEPDPDADRAVRRLLRDACRPGRTGRSVVYHGDDRGAALLTQLGVPHARAATPATEGGRDPLLVLGPGAKDIGAVVARHRGYALALGLGPEELKALGLGRRSRKLYQSPVPPGCAFVRNVLGPAEMTWRTLLEIATPTGGRPAGPGGNAGSAFDFWSGRVGGGAVGVFLCQVTPWMFDTKARPYTRTSYRRSLWAASQMLTVGKAERRSPLLTRLATPARKNEFVLPAAWKGRPDPDGAGRKGKWFAPGFDDAAWKSAVVPGRFDETFPGLTPKYDGLFWYRLRFRVPKDFAERDVTLHLGPADDESWCWLNGRLIGQVTRKERPKDYWSFPRRHPLKGGWLNRDGENVLVVLVNDTYQTGGLTGTPALRAPGAWLDSYYVQEPIAADDPYRYYRW